MRTASDLVRAADVAGGVTVDQVELVPSPAGGTTIASRMSFEDPWAAARLLQQLADQDAADPVVRAWALSILDETAKELGETITGGSLSPELWDAYAESLHANVRDQIRFVREEGEVFQSARETMRTGQGDCDCQARLLYALARAGGLTAKLLFFDGDGQPVHVVTALQDSHGDWRWAETTVAADFGEHPIDAVDRLGITGGASPFGHVEGIGGILPKFVTSQDAANLKDQLNATVVSVNRDVEACTTLDTETRIAWFYFQDSWNFFYGDKPGFWNAAAQMDRAENYATQIADRQTKLASKCTLSAPTVTPPEPTAPMIGLVKTGLIVAAVIAGALAVREVARAA